MNTSRVQKKLWKNIMSSDYRDKFENRGRYKAVREAYFHERTQERRLELLELLRDVEYLICELKRVEKRVQRGFFVSKELTALCMQLRYWEDRDRYRTDNKCLQAIAEEFHVTVSLARYYVFDITLASADFLLAVEGGADSYLKYDRDEWAERHICPYCHRALTFEKRKPRRATQ